MLGDCRCYALLEEGRSTCVGHRPRIHFCQLVGVHLMTAALVNDDLNLCCCESAVLSTSMSARYDGQRLWILWCIHVVMQHLTGSQCNCYSAGVICDHRSLLNTSRAAAFSTRYRSTSVHAGRLVNTALQ